MIRKEGLPGLVTMFSRNGRGRGAAAGVGEEGGVGAEVILERIGKSGDKASILP